MLRYADKKVDYSYSY